MMVEEEEVVTQEPAQEDRAGAELLDLEMGMKPTEVRRVNLIRQCDSVMS